MPRTEVVCRFFTRVNLGVRLICSCARQPLERKQKISGCNCWEMDGYPLEVNPFQKHLGGRLPPRFDRGRITNLHSVRVTRPQGPRSSLGGVRPSRVHAVQLHCSLAQISSFPRQSREPPQGIIFSSSSKYKVQSTKYKVQSTKYKVGE